MKEYTTCSGNEEVIFNNLLRSGRNQIECAFGLLKARWGILTRKMNLQLKAVPIVIYACFVLHNFCEMEKCPLDDGFVNKQTTLNRENDQIHTVQPDTIFTFDMKSGSTCREVITRYIKDNLPDHLAAYEDI